MKQWIGGVAIALALTSGNVEAQDSLLGRIGKGVLQASKDAVSAPATKRYLEPAGTYWDDGDPPVVDGYTRIRWGLAATASGGFGMCEDDLFAQAKAGVAMTPATRSRCIESWGHQFQRVGGAWRSGVRF
ncbi:hypothetical protein ACLMM6_05040 [Xanthomonas campestris pv. incanae]|uniref:hypothetical protein n=1 Tax=Xanthomonas campestris TaxID=339 RepID=UPI003F4D1CE4